MNTRKQIEKSLFQLEILYKKITCISISMNVCLILCYGSMS